MFAPHPGHDLGAHHLPELWACLVGMYGLFRDRVRIWYWDLKAWRQSRA